MIATKVSTLFVGHRWEVERTFPGGKDSVNRFVDGVIIKQTGGRTWKVIRFLKICVGSDHPCEYVSSRILLLNPLCLTQRLFCVSRVQNQNSGLVTLQPYWSLLRMLLKRRNLHFDSMID